MVFVAASQLPLAGEGSHGEHTANECACVPSELYLWNLNSDFI